MASSTAQIRLRGVVATGYVAIDDHDGWVGSDLNHACRLLDAQLLRTALRERANDFALCVSESVHAGIVRHGHPGIPAEDFHPVTVDSKNGPLRAWLQGPVPHDTEDHSEKGGAPVPGADSGERPVPGPDTPASAPPPGPVFNFNGGSPTFGGSLVAGNQHGVSGGQVTGDVHLGGSGGESA
jgi:hypothetical protein